MPRGQRALLDSDMLRIDRPVFMSGGVRSLAILSAPVFGTCASSRCSDRPVQGMEPVVLCGGVLALYLWPLHLWLALQRSCTAAVKLQ